MSRFLTNKDIANLPRIELVTQYENEIKRLKERLNDLSWELNPDRSGGAFDQSEINRREKW